MIPTFTIVTTLVTIGVTALLIGILVRINNPQRHKRDQTGDGGGALAADGGRSGGRQDNDGDGGADGDGSGDGGGD